MDGDRRRVLLGEGQELVAELAGRRPVDLADHLDVDVALVAGDGAGEDRLRHDDPLGPGAAPFRRLPLVPFNGARGRASLTNSSAAVSPCDRRHRVVARAGCRRAGIGGVDDDPPPGPAPRRPLRRTLGRPGRRGPGGARRGGPGRRPCSARPPRPGARRRLRHRPGRDRARPPRLRHRRASTSTPRCSTGPGPRRPTLDLASGRPRRRSPPTSPPGPFAAVGARRQRDDLRRPAAPRARCSPTSRRGSRPAVSSSPASSSPGRLTLAEYDARGDRGGPRAVGALVDVGPGALHRRWTTTWSAFTSRSRSGSPSPAR